MRWFVKFKTAAAVCGFSAAAALQAAERPNIVYVMCDDLGYGDVQCLNPERGKIPTPRIDAFAAGGMTFTDAHSGSSVCSPTRYGLLTGRYSWRSRLQSGVTQGYEPNLIAPDRPTIASFLKAQGYHTAIIGKWHLDFLYVDPQTGEPLKRPKGKVPPPVGAKVPDGPLTRGFDYYHGFHHARDMKAVIENDTVILHEPEVNMLPRLTQHAVGYIQERAKTPEQPFFLYVPFGSPHSPIVPSDEWKGKSGINDYADFVMQTDDAFGQILDALEKNGFADNTLVIFTSDNGCSKAANFKELEAAGHYASAYMRGSKADIWDGGHRIPFLVRWPGRVEAGSVSDQLLCMTDVFAVFADVTGQPLPENGAEDSVSFYPALFGKPVESARAGIVHHTVSGHFGYRMGKWKLCLAYGSGGWTAPKEKAAAEQGVPAAQLYDLENDPGETTNLYETHPEAAERLLKQLESDVNRGRSTAGPESGNDVDEIVLWKSGQS